MRTFPVHKYGSRSGKFRSGFSILDYEIIIKQITVVHSGLLNADITKMFAQTGIV
jgi:hypothetical protein